MAKPDIQLEIKNPLKSSPQAKTWWSPIGDISLWKDPKDGKWGGRIRIFALGEFYLFEKVPFVPKIDPAGQGSHEEIPEQPFTHPFGD